MQRSFLKYTIWFFIPVILGYIIVESLTLNLPMGYKYTSDYLEQNKDSIQVLVLGSSQLKDGINPSLLNVPTLNLASGDQHHDTDFKIFNELKEQLSNLKTVVIEVSYSHFELPHNGKDFWKNNIYLKFYNINAFERTTYFKDKLIFLSHPPFFSEKIYNHYILKEDFAKFDGYGFNTNNYSGRFKTLKYNETEIAKSNLKINPTPNQKIFKNNTSLFFDFLDSIKAKNLNIVICKAPMYKTYLPKRHPEILKRRDSILQIVQKSYSRVFILDKENDTLNYNVLDYTNQSHLNPKGAKTFTASLKKLLESL